MDKHTERVFTVCSSTKSACHPPCPHKTAGVDKFHGGRSSVATVSLCLVQGLQKLKQTNESNQTHFFQFYSDRRHQGPLKEETVGHACRAGASDKVKPH